MKFLVLALAIVPALFGAEKIKPDYSNVRGLNYIASYAPSDVAMWRNYDSDRVDKELGYMAGLGANSVRFWLAWVVYDVEREKFIAKFKDFLRLCRKHNITAMPIIWDSCFGDKRSSYDDLKDWVANPGTERVKDLSFRPQGDEYVKAVIGAAKGDPTVLLWDVMNEPSDEGVESWLEHYCKLIKSIDKEHPITIGWAQAQRNAVSADWVDVMSYHPYGIWDKNRDVWTKAVREISAKHGNKPILANEIGGPGLFMLYEDTMNYFASRKIGFYLFEAMIGSTRFNNVQGFFFPDGTVRDMEPVRMFQDLARKQGAKPEGRFVLKTGGPGYIPVLSKTSGAEVVNTIRNWDPKKVDKSTAAYYVALMRWTFISIAWGGGLKDHLKEAIARGQKVDAAEKAGDIEELRKLLTEAAVLAQKLLPEYDFIPKS